MDKEEILVAFPNDNAIPIALDNVKKWNIRLSNVIGDTCFVWADDVMVSMSNEDYNKVIKLKNEHNTSN
jgi:hypothetical protein